MSFISFPFKKVLKRERTNSVEAIITHAQLPWAGHVRKMDDNRLSKVVIYGELRIGKRKQGGQKLRYKDVISEHLKRTKSYRNDLEEVATNRDKWRGVIRRAAGQQGRWRRLERQATSRHTTVDAPLSPVPVMCVHVERSADPVKDWLHIHCWT